MFKNMKLTLRIALIVSILIVAILGAVTLVISLRLSWTVTQLILEENLQIAMARGDQIGEILDKLRSQLVFMAAQPQLQSKDKAVVEATVKELAKQSAAEGGALIFAYKDGSYFTSAGASGSIADRDYFVRIVARGEDFIIADAAISKSLAVPIIVVAKAIVAPDGSHIGLIAFQMKSDTLSQIVAKVKIGKTGYAYIVDRTSMVIAHPSPEIILNLKLLDSDTKGWKNLDDVGRMMGEKDSGWGEYGKPDGSTVIAYFSNIKNSPGWDLGLAVPLAEINSTRDELTMFLLILAGIGIAISIFVSVIFARSIVKPLHFVVETVGYMAEGDLEGRRLDMAYAHKVLARGDEIGDSVRSIKTMQDSLIKVVTEIGLASNQTLEGADQLSSTAQGISQGASEQAASIEELSASVEELASTVRQNADNTSQADSLARRVAANADSSGKAVSQTVESMTQIASRISIIEEIARQTNLLALNAAIEAARAGEAGKGFAVVASEVRKLAERSQKAAGEINDLSKSSVAVAAEAGKLLTELVPDIKKTAELIQEIAAASGEQASGADQIAKGVGQMDSVVQQNASASEELASTAEELSAQARRLADTIAFFTLSTDQVKKSPASAGRLGQASRPSAARSEKGDARTPGAKAAPARKQIGEAKMAPQKTAIVPVKKGDETDADFEEF